MALSDWIDAKSAIYGGFGFVVGLLLTYVRGRVRTLEYTVVHRHVALAGSHPTFGAVAVHWQGNPVTNLHHTQIKMLNDTGIDLTNLDVKVYTGGPTELLTDAASIGGVVYTVPWSSSFTTSMSVPSGQQPTPQQQNVFRTMREYHVGVLNRKQELSVDLLTTVPAGGNPGVWVSTQHPGLRVLEISNVPYTHGVPVKHAVICGLVITLAAVIATSVTFDSTWATAVVVAIVALFGQYFGALAIRIGKRAWSIIAR